MNTGILIISYKRPECLTANTLQKYGYNGDWNIVADDTDNTDYETLYPGHVIRFCKKQYYELTDTADNFEMSPSSVFARNFCWDYAKEIGYDAFGLFDDDITGFTFRYSDGDKLKGMPVERFTEIFNLYCEFILSAKIECGAFFSAGALIGGGGSTYVKKGYFSRPTNALIINTRIEPVSYPPFKSAIYEDSVYAYLNNIIGKITAEFKPISTQFVQPVRLKNAGGCTDYYTKTNKYINGFHLQMFIPTHFKWAHEFEFELSQNLPLIINEKWRKTDEE